MAWAQLFSSGNRNDIPILGTMNANRETTDVRNGDEEGANTILTIFSVAERTSEDWNSLAQRLLNVFDGRLGFSNDPQGHRILDLHDYEDNNPGAEGRVFEIRADFRATAEIGLVSLSDCRSLRQSESVQTFEKNEAVQLILQPLELYLAHKSPGLAVFDMDSTLIQQEVIDELARSVGRYDEVAAVTEAAMRGELDFEESLRARVAKLKGVSTQIWEHLKENVITITPGARELITDLQSLGWKTAVLSGGFTPLAYWLKDELQLDYAFANQLSTDESGLTLTGELLANTPVVGATVKRDLLLQLTAENYFPIAKTIAVGDGSNDLLMMKAAGFGIAFNAKPAVQAAAPARLNSHTLRDILHVLGYTRGEIASSFLARTRPTFRDLGQDPPAWVSKT